MTTAQLLILLLVIVVALVLVWLLVRRSSARKEEARVEAAGLRAEAEQVASTMAGQQAFAQQAEERAAVARAEAERLADAAGEHRAAAEATRTDYESMLARADEVDPDVSSSEVASSGDTDEDRRPMTRAEARQMREEAERTAWAGSPSAPVPGAAGAAVLGASTWSDPEPEPEPEAAAEDEPRDAEPVVADEPVVTEEPVVVEETVVVTEVVDEEPQAGEPGSHDPVEAAEDDLVTADEPAADPVDEERSARIAAAADYRDDDAPEDTSTEDVWSEPEVGTEGDMDESTGEDEARSAATDAQTPTNEWGGPHDAGAEQPAEEEAAPVTGSEPSVEESDDPFDPTPERDWAADEGALLAENAERGDELAEERAAMDRQAAEAGMEPVHPESAEPLEVEEAEEESGPADTDEPEGSEEPADEPEEAASEASEPVESQDDAPEEAATEVSEPVEAEEQEPAGAARRVSEFHEIRDGGFGMGSAAPIDDGAQPLDHPVQAYRDTMTYRLPEDPGYDEASADVWFYDAGAAERSGFHRSEG